MPRISEIDQDAIDDSPSHWIIVALIVVQCMFLVTCLVVL